VCVSEVDYRKEDVCGNMWAMIAKIRELSRSPISESQVLVWVVRIQGMCFFPPWLAAGGLVRRLPVTMDFPDPPLLPDRCPRPGRGDGRYEHAHLSSRAANAQPCPLSCASAYVPPWGSRLVSRPVAAGLLRSASA